MINNCIDCGKETTKGYRCATCYARFYRKNNPDYVKNHHLKRFNLSAEDYERIKDLQGGGCAICGSNDPDRRLAVDHDHSCCAGNYSCGECVRGLLCMNCNNGLGRFNDDISLLTRAIAYLRVKK